MNSIIESGAALRRPQAGGIAIIFVVLLIPLLALCGFAIDLGMIYSRNAEMRNIAHAIALAAAKKLNGTTGGISDAVTAAANAAAVIKYKNRTKTVTWDSAALRFGTTPNRDGSWVDAAGAATDAARIYYVKVNTRALGSAGNVTLAMLPLLSENFKVVQSNSETIAGRTGIDVAPLAICAMASTPAASRNNGTGYQELVEYGFRRGISYDLMNLSPLGKAPLHYIVNPVTRPGKTAGAADFDNATVGPYACTGSLDVPRITGDPVSVKKGFPLAALQNQLNSRFDKYDGGLCTANGAAPDANVASYPYTSMTPTPPATTATLPWMTVAPAGQTAAIAASSSILQTVADLPPPGGTASQYGPLWGYAKAVPYANYSASSPEPDNGWDTFTTSAWSKLYGGQTVKTYPAASSTPYYPGSGNEMAFPNSAHGPGLRNRRVLKVALLSCASEPSTTAQVLAVGKFFMMMPTNGTVLAGEFAGAVPVERIRATVGVFQ